MISKSIVNKYIYYFIYILIGVFVVIKGAEYHTDSYAFFRMDFNRWLMYSSFLKFFITIFGDNFELPIIIVQYSFIAIAINFVVKTIKSVFNINFLSQLFLQLILLAPCVYLHFVANRLLSEALSYPLFLLLFSYCFKAFVAEDLKYLYKASLVLFALLLTRGQFIAVIPVLLILSIYVVYKQKNLRKNIPVFLLLIIVPMLSGLTEKIFNKAVHGNFIGNSMNYVHLISSSFYVSDQEDIDLFTDEDERAYFGLIHESLRLANMTRNQVVELKMDDYEFYELNFSNICNERVHELGLQYFRNKGLNYYEQNIKLNKLCSQMVLPLFKNNFNNWTKLFYKNVKNSFGSSKQMLLMLMLLIYALVQLLKTNSNLYKFISLAILLMFANNTLISGIIHSIKRYLFYFDWVIFAIIILLFHTISKIEWDDS